VLADEGISARVDDDAWKEISEEVASGLRRGRPAPTLIHAVERCADLLVEHGVSPVNPANELSDEPRFRRD